MIITIAGGIGSGKSLTAVKHVAEESKRNIVFTNFKLKGIKYHRLKKEDIITEISDEKKSSDKKQVTKSVVNWDFWNKYKGCDIFLDEVHNLINSRNSMSKQNQLYSEWISQIRKIFGSSGDQLYLDKLKRLNSTLFNKHIEAVIGKSNNIYLITQKYRKLDVNFRELYHIHIQCHKKMIKDKVIIINDYYFGDDQYSAIEYAEMGQKPKRAIFLGNKYFKHYDSYELLSTGGEYL